MAIRNEGMKLSWHLPVRVLVRHSYLFAISFLLEFGTGRLLTSSGKDGQAERERTRAELNAFGVLGAGR
jgi:hypothetical protein